MKDIIYVSEYKTKGVYVRMRPTIHKLLIQQIKENGYRSLSEYLEKTVIEATNVKLVKEVPALEWF